MTATEIFLAVYGGLATLIGASATAYAVWNKSRSDTCINEAASKAEQNLADRNLIMTEYGTLIGEMRDEIATSKKERQALWKAMADKLAEHERCNQRLAILEAWAKRHGWINGNGG